MNITNQDGRDDENALQLYFDDEGCFEAAQEETFNDVERGTTIYFIHMPTKEVWLTRYLC